MRPIGVVLLPLVCAMLLLPALSSAQSARRLLLKDAGGRRLDLADIQAVVDGVTVPLDVRTLSGSVAAAEGASEIRLELSGDDIWSRDIVLRSDSWRPGSARAFHVARTVPTYTTQYVRQSVIWLDGGYADRGLAYLEPAFLGDEARAASTALGSYEAILRFNYARALQQACLLEGYSTCNEARQRLGKVLTEIDESQRSASFYSDQGVSRALVVKALADLDERDAAEEYQSVLSAIRGRNYESALNSIEELKAKVASSPAPFEATGVTVGRLQQDHAYVSTLAAEMR